MLPISIDHRVVKVDKENMTTTFESVMVITITQTVCQAIVETVPKEEIEKYAEQTLRAIARKV